jgi:hypothetical protein
MSMQQHRTDIATADVKVTVARDLDLEVAMISDTVVRMPYAAAPLAITAVHTPVVRMPYAAGRTHLQATKSILPIA